MSPSDASLDQGLALHRAGRLVEAAGIYEAVLRADPAQFDALHMLGVARFQMGEAVAGAALIERALTIRPDDAVAHSHLAMALAELGRLDDAVASGERALALQPDLAPARANRANALMALGRPAEALADYDQAIALGGPSPELCYNRANALRDLDRLDAALGAYADALALKPDFLEAHANRAAVLLRLEQPLQALAAYDVAITACPASAELHSARAKTLNDLMRSAEALAAADRAIALRPDFAEAHNNRGVALFDLRRLDEALASFDAAVALRGDYAEAHSNRAMTLYDLARPAEAAAACDAALAARPDFAEARLNRAISRLALGDLPGGFEDYRWRWRIPKLARQAPRLACPQWEGDALAGRRLLVHCEQGFGDSLQFVRYLPALTSMAAEVTLLTQPPLARLLRHSLGVRVIDDLAGEAGWDLHAPLLCLPRLLATTLRTIPASIPYLAADPIAAGRWAARLSALEPGRKVGLVWAGQAREHDLGALAVDRRRSLALAQFGPLARIAGIRLVSLQKGEPAAQPPPPGLDLTDWTAELGDFADTAALVSGLDLVVSVDTSVAHLAGALGKPVWVLSRFAGCWRWLNGREDSPWYPTARIFHQRAPDDWAEVVERLAQELAAWAGPTDR